MVSSWLGLPGSDREGAAVGPFPKGLDLFQLLVARLGILNLVEYVKRAGKIQQFDVSFVDASERRL